MITTISLNQNLKSIQIENLTQKLSINLKKKLEVVKLIKLKFVLNIKQFPK